MSMPSRRSELNTRLEDPGPSVPYLNVCDAGFGYKVWKRCRVEIFDPFWVSEPIPDELKPRRILVPSQVPTDLWTLLSAEERLTSCLEQAHCEARRLKLINERLYSVLGVAALLLLTLVIPYLNHE